MTYSAKFHTKFTIILVIFKLACFSAAFDSTNLHEFLTPEERLNIFNTEDGMRIPKYDVIPINWPKVHKRSTDGIITLPLKTFNKTIILSLKSIIPLVGPHTAMYLVYTKDRQIEIKTFYPFKPYFDKLYEDEAQRASLIIKTDSNGINHIETGTIGLQNLSLHRVPDRFSNSTTDKGNYYIVSQVDNLATSHRKTEKFLSFYKKPSQKVPKIVYPELLLLCEYSFSRRFAKNFQIQQYLFTFWNQVDMLYRTLDSPKFKLSIAGLAIAKDPYAFNFLRYNLFGKTLNYGATMDATGQWLNRVKHIIPIDSYDMAVIQTGTAAGSLMSWLSSSQELGEAYLGGACDVTGGSIHKIGIVFDDHKFGGIIPATHEVAHLLGVPHDGTIGCYNSDYIMAPAVQNSPNRSKWSKCSIQSFKEFLRQNGQCLFNVPEQYQEIPVTPKNPIIEETTYTNDIKNNNIDITINNNENNYINDTSVFNLDNIIPGTNTRYTELNPANAYKRTKLSNIVAIPIDPRTIPSNKIMLVQVVEKTDVYLYLLDSASKK